METTAEKNKYYEARQSIERMLAVLDNLNFTESLEDARIARQAAGTIEDQGEEMRKAVSRILDELQPINE